ncbi:MAG: hypothetical protein LBQ93_11205 [Treponema sp.]|jgi:hypothetical protein|nr:hypothetical protein [Treponema sp.]
MKKHTTLILVFLMCMGFIGCHTTEIRVVPAVFGDVRPLVVPLHQELNSNSYRERPSREIMGPGCVTKEGVIHYLKSKPSKPALSPRDIGRLIDKYFDEADVERINIDIAIAQMLYRTDSLRNAQRVSTHNYAGLDVTSVWNGRFNSMTEGVRAHIQHLKGYASTRRPNNLVDPRYEILVDLGYQGNIKTFDKLFRAWTENPAKYEIRINEILIDLYRSSGVYR